MQQRDTRPPPPIADAFWIPRLIHEFDGQPMEMFAAEMRSAEPWLALVREACQPWELLATQQSIANLAIAQCLSLQEDWSDAWWRFLTGQALDERATGGVGAASPGVPDPLPAVQAALLGWMQPWIALARIGPVPIA